MMASMRLIKKLGLATASLILITIVVLFRLTMPGTLFLYRFVNGASADDLDIEVDEVTIVAGDRAIPIRIHSPRSGFNQVMVVVHGVHSDGYGESRMLGFVKELNRLGHLVVTPDIADLKSFEIRERALSDILAAVRWTIDESGLLAPDASLKLLGFSFAGGLCIRAAANPSVRDRVSAVFSFGGHADLDRVIRYRTTGKLPEGGVLPPHIYGQAVVARQFAAKLVPAAEIDLLREVLLTYLTNDFTSVKQRLQTLPAASRKIVELCLKRDQKTLGKLLETAVTGERSHPSLSPVRGPVSRAAVFLLHGAVDNVIPPSETAALAEWRRGRRERECSSRISSITWS